MRITELTSIARAPQTDRARNFINGVVENSPLLSALNNFGLGATEDKYRPATGGQTLSARAAGGNYTAADLSPAALQDASLKFHGFSLDYDESYEADHELGIGLDMDSWLASELEERAIDSAEEIEKLLIAGDGQSNNIAGLSTILDGTNVAGLGISMVINAKQTGDTGDSFDISSEANQKEFLERLEKWMAEVDGVDFILCNRSMGARLSTIARLTNNDGQGFDQFGNPVRTIMGIPIIRVKDAVITNTEPDDAGTPVDETTSLYLCRNRVGYWTVRSNSGLATYEPGELEGKMSRRWKFEIRGFNEIKRKGAIRRVRNIKL